MDSEFLGALNPIFNLKAVQIIWIGGVFKVSQNNCLQPRVLIIASPGIFLIRKKSFAFQSKIINSISFFDLVSIYVTEQYASFSSKQSQIRIKLQSIKEVASLAFFVRQAQFPTDVLPINFSFVDEEMANTLTLTQLPYQPTSVFLDRMLSCIMHFNIYMASDLLLSKIPLPLERIFTINNEMLKSPLFQAWILSLSYDQDVEKLVFDKIKLSLLFEQCSYLFSYNRFIHTIEFCDVDFSDSAPIIHQLFSKVHNFKPTKWIFKECNLRTEIFSKFINSLALVGKKITDLHFYKCDFSDNSFSQLFQSIFFNECFHSLNSLSFDYVNAPNIYLHVSEILCCSWAMQKKCLEKISIIGNKNISDFSPLLLQMLKYDVGLKEIVLDDNTFVSPLATDEITFATATTKSKGINFLGFQKCKVSIEFLTTLFSLMKQKKIILHGIDLSCLFGLNEMEIQQFFDSLQDLSIPELEIFYFNGNKMDKKQCLLFTQFLKNQKFLKCLSINCIIDIHDSPIGLNSFIEYVENANELNVLSLRGNQTLEFSYGRLIFSLLQNLSNIQILDISNQCIGQEGLELILPYITSGQLTEIFFDGSNVKSFDFLNQFCITILSSKLKSSSFPVNDFNKCINFINSKENPILIVDSLKQKFVSRFGCTKNNMCPKYMKSFPKLNKNDSKISTSNLNLIQNNKNTEEKHLDIHHIIEKNEIMQLFDECINVDKPSESIISLISIVDKSLSFEKLLREIK